MFVVVSLFRNAELRYAFKLKHFKIVYNLYLLLLVCSKMLSCVVLKLKHFQDSIKSVFVVGLFRNAELRYA